jgi:hypothetical protein
MAHMCDTCHTCVTYATHATYATLAQWHGPCINLHASTLPGIVQGPRLLLTPPLCCAAPSCALPPSPPGPGLPCTAHFSRAREPKVLITTCYKPSKGMYAFLAEMLVSRLW